MTNIKTPEKVSVVAVDKVDFSSNKEVINGKGSCKTEENEKRVSRLGIFVFYNKNGIVNESTSFMLKQMSVLFERLIIVVNGSLSEEGREILKRYSTELHIRENIGYDGGAYKDVFLKYLKNEEWKEYEEIVLFNDTFYGPFIPMEPIFQTMEKEEVDFWGLSRWPEGKEGMVNGIRKLPSHIQSYFLVINKKMACSEAFFDFWKNLNYPDSYDDAIEYFEIGFTQCFSKKGFVYKSWIDYWNEKKLNEKIITINQVFHIYEMDFPIAKKKMVSLLDDKKLEKFVEYLNHIETFPVSEMLEERLEIQREGKSLPYSLNKLKQFIVDKEKLYIYGNGHYKNMLMTYLKYNNYYVDGIVVTKRKINEENVIEFSELRLGDNDGIIVALGDDNAHEVKAFMENKVGLEKVLFPYYIVTEENR